LYIQPRTDTLSISIRENRREPTITSIIRTKKEIGVAKPKIKEAYEKIK
jgi:hypothetical protein